MAGIEDLTNIMMAGGRGDVPPPGGMGGPPPGGVGGPPPGGMGGPPMDPGMGGPPPGGMGGPPMGPGIGEMAVAGGSPMGGPPADIEQDSAMLAEAVVERAQGDIGQAIAVLDTAKAMLVASAEQPPMNGMGGPPMGGPPPGGMGGPPMQAAYGRPLMRRGGGPLYREHGGGMSESDILRQMVMGNLQEGRAPSDRGVAFHSEMLRKALGQGQTGRTLSDKDLASLLDMIGQGQTGRAPSDRDTGQTGRAPSDKDRALKRLMKYRSS